MAIEHKDISDPNIHEPKGASSALEGSVYVANGSGSGSFRPLTIREVGGVSIPTDGGKKLVTTSTGDVEGVQDFAVGATTITNNPNGFPVTASGDPLLNASEGYAPFTGAGAPWTSGESHGVSSYTGGLEIITTGIYQVTYYLSIRNTPSVNTDIGVRILLNEETILNRKVVTTSHLNKALITATEIITLTSGSRVGIAIASEDSGNIIVEDASLIVSLVGVN